MFRKKYLNHEIGDQLNITINSIDDKKHQGTITFIARQAEFSPGNVQTPEERSKQVFRIKVVMENSDELKLRPGMTTDIWLTKAE